jgi:hypothetical protein
MGWPGLSRPGTDHPVTPPRALSNVSRTMTDLELDAEDGETLHLDPTHESSSVERFWELTLILMAELHSTVGAFGQDVVLECGSVSRHVEIKRRKSTGKRSRYSVNTTLAERPSGCVVWIGWSQYPPPTESAWNSEVWRGTMRAFAGPGVASRQPLERKRYGRKNPRARTLWGTESRVLVYH